MKRYLIALGLVFFALVANAQDAKDSKTEIKERIDQEKTSFFTEKISLTQAQSPKFWSLYNEYREQEKALRKLEMTLVRKGKVGGLSAEQYSDIVEGLLDIEEDRQELQEKFFENIAKFLTPEQMFRYYEATKEFQSKLLNRLKLPANPKVTRLKK